jgi:hypothetical protein
MYNPYSLYNSPLIITRENQLLTKLVETKKAE